jgi:hypothetical protein
VAGSWQHMTTPKGKLRSNESFCGMIENLGDAYETAEECFGMVWWLARALAEHEPDVSREQWIARAEQHYRDGLELGGVQRSR